MWIYLIPTHVCFRLVQIQMFCMSCLAFLLFSFHWYLHYSDLKYQKYAQCFNQSNCIDFLFNVKMKNICNLIGWNSVHIFDSFNCFSGNINGMWNARKLGEIYKTFEFILSKTIMCRYMVSDKVYGSEINNLVSTCFSK